VCEAG
jgi:hypothetical protein